MTIKKSISWYESLPDEGRFKLLSEFGNDDIPDREMKFYKWIKSFSKTKQKEYE